MALLFVVIASLSLLASIAFAAESGYVTASFRKDFYLPQFKESIDYPTPIDGGRVHLVVTNTSCASVSSAKINGQEAVSLPSTGTLDFTYFDWAKVLQNLDTKQVVISFHSRNVAWLGNSANSGKGSLLLQLSDATGLCFSGVAIVYPSQPVTLSYATTANNFTEIITHVHNSGSSDATVAYLEVQGERINGPFQIGSGQSWVHVYAVPGPALYTGSVWAVSLAVVGVPADSSPFGWGGRVIPERFPIEAWPTSTDCPYKEFEPAKYAQLLDNAIDTLYIYSDKCPKSRADIVNTMATDGSTTRAWVDPKVLKSLTPAGLDIVDMVFLGDEVDGQMNANLRDPTDSMIRGTFPTKVTYQGAKTNGEVGSYAGITDVQGIDAYNSACAPTMVPVLDAFPIEYPYLYIRNGRDNHAPLPSMLYSQLYDGTPPNSTLLGWSYQANENELVTQVAMVVLAGAKGMTTFEFISGFFSYYKINSSSNSVLNSALRSVSALREVLRTGDIQGLTFKSSAQLNEDIMVEVIRSPSKVVLVVLNVKAGGYSNLTCHVFIGTHWSFSKFTVDSITLTNTPVKLTNFQEVVAGQTVAPLSGASATITASQVTVNNIAVDDQMTVRFFTFDVVAN